MKRTGVIFLLVVVVGVAVGGVGSPTADEYTLDEHHMDIGWEQTANVSGSSVTDHPEWAVGVHHNFTLEDPPESKENVVIENGTAELAEDADTGYLEYTAAVDTSTYDGTATFDKGLSLNSYISVDHGNETVIRATLTRYSELHDELHWFGAEFYDSSYAHETEFESENQTLTSTAIVYEDISTAEDAFDEKVDVDYVTDSEPIGDQGVYYEVPYQVKDRDKSVIVVQDGPVVTQLSHEGSESRQETVGYAEMVHQSGGPLPGGLRWALIPLGVLGTGAGVYYYRIRDLDVEYV